MSYCRFSCLDYKSDVYCFESDTGIQIYVSGCRHKPVRPLPMQLPEGATTKACIARHVEVMSIIKDSSTEPIGLPCDNDAYSFTNPGDAADKLEELRLMGYVVPDYAIEELRQEQKDEQ